MKVKFAKVISLVIAVALFAILTPTRSYGQEEQNASEVLDNAIETIKDSRSKPRSLTQIMLNNPSLASSYVATAFRESRDSNFSLQDLQNSLLVQRRLLQEYIEHGRGNGPQEQLTRAEASLEFIKDIQPLFDEMVTNPEEYGVGYLLERPVVEAEDEEPDYWGPFLLIGFVFSIIVAIVVRMSRMKTAA